MKSQVLKCSTLVFISLLSNSPTFAGPFQFAQVFKSLSFNTDNKNLPSSENQATPKENVSDEAITSSETTDAVSSSEETSDIASAGNNSNAPEPQTNIEKVSKQETNAIPSQKKNISKPVAQQVAAPKSSNDLISLKELQQRIAVLEHKQRQEVKSRVIDPVLALPQVNLRSKYDTAPIYNQDQAMLIMRKNYEREIIRNGIRPIPMPRIEVGGNLVALALRNTGPNAPPIDGAIQSDIQLSGANLNITSEILQYCLGALRISYNPLAPFRFDPTYNAGYINTRVDNSNIYLNTGFITLGDLAKAPVYLSLGQMFLPFGEYGSSLATAILPARLGRFRQRTILFGVKQPGKDTGWDFQAFAFKGDTRTGVNPDQISENPVSNRVTAKGGTSGVIDNGGLNIGYKGKIGGIGFSSGFSYVLNIADSGGMQNAGASTIVNNGGELIDNNFLDNEDLDEIEFEPLPNTPTYTFAGFGADRNFLIHGVPAVDFRGKINFENLPISFMGEIVGCTRAFDSINLSYNSNYFDLVDNGFSSRDITLADAQTVLWGAKPVAWHLEGTYKFGVWGVPSALTIGGGQSLQAMALNLPASIMLGTLRFNFKRWLSLAVNYMYQAAYPKNAIGTGELQPSTTDRFAGTNQQMLSGQLTARF